MTEYLQYNAPVVLTFFFISFVALLLSWMTKGRSNDFLFMSYRSSPFNPLTYVRLFTHVLGHENWNHFRHNFLIILLVGPMLEEKYGGMNILILILITAGITSLINIIVGKYRILGASGIVYAFIALSSFVNIQDGKIPITLLLIIIFYIADEIFLGLFKKDHVSHSAHLLGAICGVIFGFYFL